jgi:UDP-glucose 4-epimerase
MSKNVLVTGGAGYIGSHTVIELLAEGFNPVLLDDLSNSSKDSLARIKDVTGKTVKLIVGDYTDLKLLEETIAAEHIDAIIHFAASKYVAESMARPLKYYQNNVAGFIGLLGAAQRSGLPVIFSSSAATYGNPTVDKVTEETPTNPESPYGASKLMDEIILRDACHGERPLKGIGLRYFNVIGAHPSGKNGETLTKQSQNIWPFLVKAASGELPELTIFGGDYPTTDGTCLRDYVHVVDLAEAHVAALKYIFDQPAGYFDIFNIGTGKPTSVLQLVKVFESVNKVKLPYKIAARRPGDPAAYYAVVNKANSVLNWKAKKTLDDAVADGWRWQQKQ